MFAIALVGFIENVLFMLFLGIMLIAGLLLWHGWLPSWLWWVWLFLRRMPRGRCRAGRFGSQGRLRG